MTDFTNMTFKQMQDMIISLQSENKELKGWYEGAVKTVNELKKENEKLKKDNESLDHRVDYYYKKYQKAQNPNWRNDERFSHWK